MGDGQFPSIPKVWKLFLLTDHTSNAHLPLSQTRLSKSFQGKKLYGKENQSTIIWLLRPVVVKSLRLLSLSIS